MSVEMDRPYIDLRKKSEVKALEFENDFLWKRLFDTYKEAGGILNFEEFKERERTLAQKDWERKHP